MTEDFDRILVRTSRDALVVFAGNVISTLLLAVSAMIVARMLQPENYGIYSVSLTVTNVLTLFTDFGIDSALVKYVSKFRATGKEEIVREVIVKGLLLKLVIVTVASVINYVFAYQLSVILTERPELSDYVKLTSILTFTITLMNTTLAILTALGRMKLRSFHVIVQSITKLLLSPLLVIIGLSVLGALLGHVISYTVTCVIGVTIVLRYVRSLGRREEIVSVLDLIRFGLPLYVSGLLGAVLYRFQYVLLARVATNVELGNIQAANQFVTLVALTITPFTVTLFPVFSALETRGNRNELRDFLNNVLRYMTIFTVQVAAMIGAFSMDVVRLIYGRTYVTAPHYLTLMSLGYLYTPFTASLSALYSGLGRTKDLMNASIIQFAVILPVSYALINYLGPTGYSIVLSISSLPALTYQLSVLKRLNMSVEWKPLTLVYVASLISVALPLLIHTVISNYVVRLLIELPVAIGTYMIVLTFTGGFTRGDCEFLSRSFATLPLIGWVMNLLLTMEDKLLNLRDRLSRGRRRV
ncbi:MAG: flippase [Zestosphaera sp.]